MDVVSPQEKEKALKDFNRKQENMYRTGKYIVFSMATIHILLSIISFFLNFNFISLVIQIALSIALYCGIVWVRYLFAIGAALASMLILYTFGGGYLGADVPVPVTIFLAIHLIYEIISAVVLFASKNVSEFLYAQKNG